MAEATLIVGRTSSTCSACHRNAFPDEWEHNTVKFAVPESTWESPFGEKKVFPAREGEPGCGATFTAITTCYLGPHMEAATRNLRPDLPFVGVDQPYLGG